jgi:hypothetical protein
MQIQKQFASYSGKSYFQDLEFQELSSVMAESISTKASSMGYLQNMVFIVTE